MGSVFAVSIFLLVSAFVVVSVVGAMMPSSAGVGSVWMISSLIL